MRSRSTWDGPIGKETLRMRPLDETGRPVATFSKGRRCTSCNKRLSMYNPDSKCWQCDPYHEKVRV